MSRISIINAKIRAGIWEAEVTGDADTAPIITVVHQGKQLSGIDSAFDASRGAWLICVPIPTALINDGLQSFAVMDGDGKTIHHFTIQTGTQLGDDLSAEVALLRNELELLKTAFRKHCSES